MKRLIAAVAVLALLAPSASPPLHAQAVSESVGNFMYRYDLDSTTLIFCKLVGRNGDPFGGAMLGTARIKTTGTSADLDAVTAGQNPFAGMAKDDVIIVRSPSGAIETRVIDTFVDADNVTVESTINLDTATGFVFTWFDTQCGTAATDGWIDASSQDDVRTMTYLVEQINTTTGVDMRMECKTSGLGATPIQVYPATGFVVTTTASIASHTGADVSGKFSACRVGVKITSTDDGGDTGANSERITATLVK